jgi:hypothetical protein
MAQTKSPALFSRGTAIDFLALTALWLVAVLIVNPRGDFPLNDDWAASRSVKQLVEHGVYQPTGWMAMTLIIHVFWGALFCIPHGFSFMAVRISTLVLSLVGVLGVYVLIRQLDRPRWLAMFCALTLCFNPVYFSLSNTFMTDVPFTAWEILACLFFVRYLQMEKNFDLCIAATLAIVALLIRQLGLAIPMAFGVAFLFKKGFKKHSWIRAALPAILTAGTLIAFNHWLQVSGRAVGDYNLAFAQMVGKSKHPLMLPLNFAHYGWVMLMYLGLFLLPIFATVKFNRQTEVEKSRSTFWVFLALFGLLTLTVGHYFLKTALMPVHLNILDPWGLGPLTLCDTQMLKLPDVPLLPTAFWVVVTGLSLLGAGLLVTIVVKEVPRLVSEYRSHNVSAPPVDSQLNNTLAIFFLSSTLIYLGPLLINGFFDRYLLTAIVMLGAFVVVSLPVIEQPPISLRYFAGILLVVGFAGYSIAGTRDYLEWNRIRWEALADLQRENISPRQIDGGFEFNGWLFYDPKFHGSHHKSDWWVQDDEYILSFGQLAGYAIHREYQYTHWMPPYVGKILVLKRMAVETNTLDNRDSAAIIRP